MKINYKHLSERFFNALAATTLVAATIHIGVSLIAAIISRSTLYMNPIEFLGFGFLLPDYLNSVVGLCIAWGILALLCGLFIYFHAYVFVTVSVKPRSIRQTVIRIGRGANARLRQAARQLRAPDPSDRK